MVTASRPWFYALSVFAAVLIGTFIPCPAAEKNAPLSTEELTKRAEIIVKAKVASWILTLDDGAVKGGEFPTRLAQAVLEVRKYEKGTGSKLIELRFPVTDPARGPAPDSTVIKPKDIEIVTGRTYRFYLKKVANAKWCVTALDGEVDDAAAVQELVK